MRRSRLQVLLVVRRLTREERTAREDWSYDDNGTPKIPIKKEPPVQPSRPAAEKDRALQGQTQGKCCTPDRPEAAAPVPRLLTKYSKVADALSTGRFKQMVMTSLMMPCWWLLMLRG